MNRQDAKVAKDSGVVEPSAELDDLAHRVIGAAIEVHRLHQACRPNPTKTWRSWRLGGSSSLKCFTYSRTRPKPSKASAQDRARRSSRRGVTIGYWTKL